VGLGFSSSDLYLERRSLKLKKMFSLKVDDELELSLPSSSRIEEAYRVVLENYEHLHEWMPWANEGLTLESVGEYYKRTLRKFANEEDEIGLNVVFRGKVVGGIGLHEINRGDRSAEIGYWLAKSAEGRGLMTKSAARLIEFGFDELKLNRLVIKCVPENTKSRAIPERLGFTVEGVEREAGWLHTRFVDHVVYSLLARERREKRSGQ
jgi:ribosomal-protein-serine acetyltransferase